MKEDIRTMVDEDILEGRLFWEEFSHDGEKMEQLFLRLFTRYGEQIEGFSKGLHVMQPYEGSAKKAEVYRENCRMLMERLCGFRENGYENEGLMEYYLKKEHREVKLDVDFTDIRLEIGMMSGVSHGEKEEIMEKLGEMEGIVAQVIFKREKWDLLREYMVWLSGKDVDIAMRILPLFLKIS